MAIRPRNLP